MGVSKAASENSRSCSVTTKTSCRAKEVPMGSQLRDQIFAKDLVHHDELTSTITNVTHHKDKEEVIVTIVAAVRTRNPKDKNALRDSLENSVILASQAIAQSAGALEEKANALKLLTKMKSRRTHENNNSSSDSNNADQVKEVETKVSEVCVEDIEECPVHQRIVHELEKLRVVEGTQIRNGFYAGTPFRPVYRVKLERIDGTFTDALLKPATPGDVHCRWGHASSDWVAYKIGRLLGTDMVPPSTMRKDVKLGENHFSLATLMHYVPQVKPLTRLSLQEWGGELPAIFVSNAHILDALLGSCPRARNMFMEGPSWTQAGAKQAMLLDHPMGPDQGKLHPMWTQRGQISGVKCVSRSTLTRLRCLNQRILTTALDKWVSSTEIDGIVQRLEQVLAYFDSVAQNGNKALAIV